MPTWLIVLLSIIGGITLITLLSRIGKKERDKKKRLAHLDRISQWEKGDQLDVKESSLYDMKQIMDIDVQRAKKQGKKTRSYMRNHVELISWGEEEFVYKTECGATYYGSYNEISINTTANRRQRDNKMDKFMDSLTDIAKFREDRLSKLLDKDKKKEEDN